MSTSGPVNTVPVASVQPVLLVQPVQQVQPVQPMVGSKDPRAALDPLNEPTLGERAQQAALNAVSSIAAAATSAAEAISLKAHEVDVRYHMSEKASDAVAFAGTAIKHGNPVHAAKHVSSAGAIGEAERAKHANGPLPEGLHTVESANTVDPLKQNQVPAAAQPEVRSEMSEKAHDAVSFAETALKQGHPIHAAKYASTAATIGEAERAKHASGPLSDGVHTVPSANAVDPFKQNTA